MKKILLLSNLVSSLTLFSQQAPTPYGPLPTKAQLNWHEMEMYCLIHFGVNTYLDKEWGYGDEDPALVNPVKFNASQIVGAAKAGGFKGVIVVAKHHDGLCLWPTKTTSHNISKSPWKNGKGDILKEYQLACNKLGMKLGIYCSPWDRNNAQYGTAEYLKIYRAQLKELYSWYGPLFTSWHDGANGGDGYYGGARETRRIDHSTYYDWDSTWRITRKMQPMAVLFGDVGPDMRWVGNEMGFAGETCWATYTPIAPEPGKKPANGYVIAREAIQGHRDGKYWMPAECDVPIRPGWFYHASQNPQVKTASELLDLYYQSVGRGAALDLGISPNKDGLLDDADVASMKLFGDLLRKTFSVNFAKDAKLKASNIRGNNISKFGPQNLFDNDRYSYWSTDDHIKTPELIIDLPKQSTFNVIRVRENIKLGQRVEGIAVDIMENKQWKEIGKATSIGSIRLIRLTKDVTAKKLRLRVTASPVCIALSDFGLYKEPQHLREPAISRDRYGMVTIQAKEEGIISYTLDGKEPTIHSFVYNKPFLLVGGGVVKARSFKSNQLPGDIKTMIFGTGKKDWKVISASETKTASNVIDEDEQTTWNTFPADNSKGKLPQEVVIDMGETKSIKAFTYLPRQDGKHEGLVHRYAFYTSENGRDWVEARKGDFHNIEANPVQQLVILSKPVNARYFKFIAEAATRNGAVVAELGITTR